MIYWPNAPIWAATVAGYLGILAVLALVNFYYKHKKRDSWRDEDESWSWRSLLGYTTGFYVALWLIVFAVVQVFIVIPAQR